MQYKLQNNQFGEPCAVTIIGQNISIPFDPANTDYQEYLAWLSCGNVPLPPDEMGGDTSTTVTTE
jgi:hypothetical protein